MPALTRFRTRLFGAARRGARRPGRPALRLELLEARLAPAHDVTVQAGGATAIPAGATTFTDAHDYVIDPSAFAAARSDVTLQATDNITFDKGVQLAAGLTLTLQAQNQIVDDLPPAAGGGSPPGAPAFNPVVSATNLALAAGAGLPGGPTRFQTQVSNLVAQGGAAGLTLYNWGDLALGFGGAPFRGVSTGGAPVSIVTSGGLTVNQDVTAGAASVYLGAGPGATLTNNAAVSISGDGQTITLQADRMALQGGTVSAAGAAAAVLQPVSAAWAVDLGSTGDTAANTLELSDAELNTVSAVLLVVGGLPVGPVGAAPTSLTVTAAIAPAHAGALELVAQSVGQTTGTVTASQFVAVGYDGVNLPGANRVGALAGRTDGAAFTFNNAGPLFVGQVSGTDGVSTTVYQTTGVSPGVVIGGPVPTLYGTPYSGPVAVTSGGDLTVGAIDARASTVTLTAAGAVRGAGVIFADSLAVSATGVGSAAAPLTTAVNALAVNAGAGDVVVENVGPPVLSLSLSSQPPAPEVMTVGAVGGLSGITAGGVVFLYTPGELRVGQDIRTAGDVTLWANAQPGAVGLLDVAPGATVRSAAGRVRLLGSSGVIVQSGATVRAAGVLDADGAFGGGPGGVAVQGTLSGSGPVNVASGPGGETLLLDFAGGAALPGGLSFSGQGRDTLLINDAGSTDAHTYTLTDGAVNRSGSGLLTYGGLAALSIAAGDGNDAVSLQGAAPGTATAVYGGGGDDLFTAHVAPDSNYQNVLLDGGPGDDTLTVTDDSGSAALSNRQTGPGSGSVVVQYAGGASVLNYEGMEHVQTDRAVAPAFAPADQVV